MIELKLLRSFPRRIIAVDEVGRSPLSGPVVIGAVELEILEKNSLEGLLRSLRRVGVKDSKLLAPQRRRELLEKLGVGEREFRRPDSFLWKGVKLSYVTWEMGPAVIDAENIFESTRRGMKEAALRLFSGAGEGTTLLIDGNARLRWDGEAPWEEITIVRGDVKSPLIGLASIIAKEKRDAFMKEMHEKYPVYGFDKNFGYPTAFHRRAIEEHGPCAIHRKSFGKVREFILTGGL